MLAAMKGHVNVVQCLVEAGANLEAVNKVSGHVVVSMWMCDMVIDAGWINSIDVGCPGGSCECGAMLGGGGSEPRGSKQGELTFMIVRIYVS